MKSFYSTDFENFDQRYRSTLFNSISGFKSLNIVGSCSELGISNLGLFNSIFHIGANPFLLGFIVRPEGPEHDTLKNIRKTNQYTFNLVSEDIYVNAHQTSARYPSGVSEFDPCGLSEWVSDSGFKPYVNESPIRIGLEVREIIPIELNGTKIVIGEVKEFHCENEDVLQIDGFIDLEKAKIMTCVGLDAYYLPNLLSRLPYAKPTEKK